SWSVLSKVICVHSPRRPAARRGQRREEDLARWPRSSADDVVAWLASPIVMGIVRAITRWLLWITWPRREQWPFGPLPELARPGRRGVCGARGEGLARAAQPGQRRERSRAGPGPPQRSTRRTTPRPPGPT